MHDPRSLSCVCRQSWDPARPGVLSPSAIFGHSPKIGCQECHVLETLKLSKKPLCDRTNERAFDGTCELGYERLAALPPGRRSLPHPGWYGDGSLGRVLGGPCRLAPCV
jgi:hypothetical protein